MEENTLGKNRENILMPSGVVINRKNLLIFDLDGTIINVFGCGRKALDTTMRIMYGIKGAGEKLDFSSSTDYGVFLRLIEQFNLNDIFFNRIEEFYSIYSKELKEEIEKNAGSRLLPGLTELLEYLFREPSFYLALATGNMEVGARTKLGHFGLEEYFPVGGFGDHAKSKKDVISTTFQKASEFYGENFKNDEVFVIGDTTMDIDAAKNFEFHSIAVATGFEEKEKLIQANPDWLFDNISSTSEFLKVISNLYLI